MIIEFFGMPGTGKTTTAQRLVTETDWEIARVWGRRELLMRTMLLFCAHPVRVTVLFLYIVRNSKSVRMFRYKSANLFFHTNAAYHKALKMPRALFDQGYCQNLISLFEDPISEQAMKRYISWAFVPDLVVVFEAPLSDIANRLEGREYIVRSRYGEEAFQERLSVMGANF
jgi:hypothetical protein